MFSEKTKFPIALGFAAVLGLMLLVVAIGIDRMSLNNGRLEQVVNQSYVKTSLIIRMYATVRARSVTLLRLLSIEEPFRRDELAMRLFEQANSLSEASGSLTKMNLDGREQQDFDLQSALARRILPIQTQVLDHLYAGELAEARQRLLQDVIPAQDQILTHLNGMLEYQQESARQALSDAQRQFSDTVISFAVLTVLAVIVGGAIAVLVVRHTGRASDALFAVTALQSIGDGVISTDARGRVVFVNETAEVLTGLRLVEARGQPLLSVLKLVDESSGVAADDPVAGAIRAGRTVRQASQLALVNTSGTTMSVDLSVSPIWNEEERIVGAVLAFRDVGEERRLREQLTYQASHDALTGLINRLEFEHRLTHILQEADIDESLHTVLYFDLDQFKVVNDTCGHVAGDALLRQLSELVQHRLRANDRLARLGGDEFAVLLERCPAERGNEIAQDLLETIRSYRFLWEDKTFSVGASIGVVGINGRNEGLNVVLRCADEACYAAKDAGRNRVHMYSEADSELVHRQGEMQWVSRINGALREDRFALYFQSIAPLPRGSLSAGASVSGEILLRMREEDGSLVPPGAFLPAAERYHLVGAVDRWVVCNTFQWLQENHAQLPAIDKISINLSGHSLGDEETLAFVIEQFRLCRIDPRRICFEITETAAIANLRKATQFITALKELGCFFALDDFGSGLSSFAYLKNLPVDFLKIDGLFVKDILEDPIDEAMVRSINDIGQVMGKRTIAEFVENDAVADKLYEIGVDFGQGYGIAVPKPLDVLLVAPAAARAVG